MQIRHPYFHRLDKQGPADAREIVEDRRVKRAVNDVKCASVAQDQAGLSFWLAGQVEQVVGIEWQDKARIGTAAQQMPLLPYAGQEVL